MRYSCKESVEYDLKLHYNLRDKYQQELSARSAYKNCRLKSSSSVLEPGFYSYKKENASKFTYAGRESHSDIRAAREYAFFQKAVKVIDANIAAMEGFLAIYKNTRAENINELLGRLYQLPRNDLLLLAEPEVDRWLKEKQLEKSKFPVFDPAGLTVTAFDGTPMRSRAEAAHYEAFFIYNIPAIFEFPYQIGSEVYRPDFTTLYVYTMNQYMWEHLGNWFHNNMHKRDQYRSESIFRWDAFSKIGYYPESNLILTFGSSENKFDVQAIHRKVISLAVPPPSPETIEMLKRC